MTDRLGGRSQLGTILLLFVALRLTILFFYAPQGPLYRYTDFQFYYATAQLSERGIYPFVNMWYEYPPLLAYLPQAVYAIARLVAPTSSPEHYTVFSRLLSLVLLAFDTGSLILLHQLGRRSWGVERANWMGWVYSGLSLPLLMLTYVHQGMAVFSLLLATELFTGGRNRLSAAALGLAVAVKLLPVFLIGPVVRFLLPDRKRVIETVLIVICTAALTYLPFLLLGGGAWIVASFRALANAHSYATIWALFDSNWMPGYYGALETRLRLNASGAVYGNPPVVPGIASLLLFGGIYAFFFVRPLPRRDSQTFLQFSLLTLSLFHLWLKGWSPQYVLAVVPFLLFALPDWRGLVAVLLLSAISTTHWTGSQPAMAALILSRTAFFIGTVWIISRRLFRGTTAPS